MVGGEKNYRCRQTLENPCLLAISAPWGILGSGSPSGVHRMSMPHLVGLGFICVYNEVK